MHFPLVGKRDVLYGRVMFSPLHLRASDVAVVHWQNCGGLVTEVPQKLESLWLFLMENVIPLYHQAGSCMEWPENSQAPFNEQEQWQSEDHCTNWHGSLKENSNS